MIQTEFFLASPDQERICIIQKDQRKDRDHEDPKSQHRLQGIPARKIPDLKTLRKEHNDIEHHHHADTGQYIRKIQLSVLPDTCSRKLYIKSSPHRLSPPVASMVSVADTF